MSYRSFKQLVKKGAGGSAVRAVEAHCAHFAEGETLLDWREDLPGRSLEFRFHIRA